MSDYTEPTFNEYGQAIAGECEFCGLPISYEPDGDWDGEKFVDCGTWVARPGLVNNAREICPDSFTESTRFSSKT